MKNLQCFPPQEIAQANSWIAASQARGEACLSCSSEDAESNSPHPDPPHEAAGGRARFPQRAATACRGFMGGALGTARLIMARLVQGLLVGAVVLALASGLRAATNDPTTALQRALFEEEANHNLDAAIQGYQSVLTQFERDRKLAATAVFRLGECYRKQGKTNEANAQYERVLREFSEQAPLATLSRQYLAASGSAPAETSQLVLSPAAREEQKRLLLEEIKVVEQKLREDQKKKEVGIETPDHYQTERDLLQLKRQLAALEAGTPPPATSDALRQARAELAALLVDYGPEHPAVKAKQKQIASLEATEPGAGLTSSEAEEVKRIQAMIKDSPDLINAKDGQNGNTPLHVAASNGQLTVAQFLVGNGADIDAKNRLGRTPLHLAAGAGHKAIIELLLGKNAAVQSQDNNGYTPLHLAAENGFRAIVELLLARGADVNAKAQSGATPLHMAVANGHKSIVELLLARKADVNVVAAQFQSGRKTFWGTPLHVAVETDDPGLTELLLTNKASVNEVDVSDNSGRQTALHIAAREGRADIAALLLARGADVTLRDNTNPRGQGWTPLHLALCSERRQVMELLLKNKADPNVRLDADLSGGNYAKGYTPLLFALEKGQLEMAKLLLDYNADPNLKGDKGESALLAAFGTKQRQQMLSLLLEHGADPNARSPSGQTVLMRAVSQHDREAVDLLLAHKADPNARDRPGRTPLHYAAQTSFQALANSPTAADLTAIAERLLAAGADVNLRDEQGKTALTILNMSHPGLDSDAGPFCDWLRQHGAMSDLPMMDALQVRRPSANFSQVLLRRGTNDWNQFTALELIAMTYDLLTPVPQGEAKEYVTLSNWANRQSLRPLVFPDFASLRIRTPAADQKSWQERTADLSGVIGAGDCSKDVPLAWGDVVELPEADHPLNEQWRGFTYAGLTNLHKCLSREVEVVVKGRATKMTLAPSFDFLAPSPFPSPERTIHTRTPFWLKPALRDSNLVLTSSDLSRVKVTRRDPATGQERQWIFDCSDSQPAPEFWLRNGDRIEVPEKP